MPFPATENCLLLSVITFLGGVFSGTVLGHFLAIGRERRLRKREFYQWLMEWKSNPAESAEGNELLVEFLNKRNVLNGRAAAIEYDLALWNRKRFRKSVSAVTSLKTLRREEENKNDLADALANLSELVR